jgi:hypothetical protein
MTQNSSTMLHALAAHGPAPEYAAELHTFGQFVGSWELNCTEYEPDGTSRTLPGEWHFDWVLEGRAIQDVWILPSREQRARPGTEAVEWGTAVRFYDPAIAAWRVSWSGPGRGRSYAFVARERGGAIVLEGDGDAGAQLRWRFSEITSDRFRWTNEIRWPDEDWSLQQEMDVCRLGAVTLQRA